MGLHKDLTGADLHINKVHADTHVVAGTDPLVLAEGQVTSLTTDLAAKVVGPSVAINGHVAILDGVSGKLIKDGGARMPASVFDYGAKGDFSTDDTAAFQAAIDALPAGSVLLVGIHRLFGSLTITKHITFRGISYTNGNNAVSTSSCMYFDHGQAVNIISTGQLGFEYLVLRGTGVGIGVQVQESVILEHVTIQGFVTGLAVTHGYFCKLNNSYIGYCDNGITFDNCYNINMVGMSLSHINLTAITLTNASSLRMFGGSIEGFQISGISVLGASSCDLFGVYFEGTQLVDGVGDSISAATGANIVAIGCHVYLTAAASFLNASNALNLRLYSHNNRFIYPTGANYCHVYTFHAADAGTSVDIAGDNWSATAGAGCVYSSITDAAVGMYRILFPAGNPLYGQNVDRTTQLKLSALNTAPANAGATGTLGEIRVTAGAIYVCTATNTWVKTVLATWA